MPREYNEDEDPAARRRKSASYYAKLRQQEIERERELAEKYRDRAKERRDGVNKDYEETELISTTANYRAVGPTAEADKSAAEKRRQLIQESKFLGGDMEHTHLVKGLDFALLQKVRAEIASKEKEEEELMEKPQNETKKDEDPENKIEFKTRLGRNVYRILFKTKAYERNELYLPGRMAYVVDLDDEYADTDIPTTLIRSKADCPTMEAQTTLTTNDIVISKLTQILSYLRQGTRNKKLKKKDKAGKLDEKKPPEADMNIFEDIGDYVPTAAKVPREKDRERYRERDRERERRERERERERDREREREREREEEKKRTQRNGLAQPRPASAARGTLKKPEDKKQLGDFFGMSNSYAECYPATMDDMAVDSDEEVDYSKMDQGNKKGPLGRWDFDTQEEYSEYMNNKEALPKAAFQYGIKMSEGRKTRRFKETNDKAELDRGPVLSLQIIEKRKKLEADGGGAPPAWPERVSGWGWGEEALSLPSTPARLDPLGSSSAPNPDPTKADPEEEPEPEPEPRLRDTPEDISFEAAANTIAFHPSQDILAAGDVEGDVYVYSLSFLEGGNRELWSSGHHLKSCREVAFSHDGHKLFTVSKDKAIHVLSVEQGRLVTRFSKAHSVALNSLLVLDEQLLATGDEGGTLRLWDLRRGAAVMDLRQHEEYIGAMAVDQHKRLLLTASGDGTMGVFNIRRRRFELVSEPQSGDLTSIALMKAQRGKKVACGSSEGTIYLFNWAGFGATSDRFAIKAESIDCMVPVTDNVLCTGSTDGVPRAVNILPNRVIGSVGQHVGGPVEEL
uniref:IK cytokine n=1 Tax=Pelodiscus sinensis TaxID=13735 RepID=K7FIV7_PELSI